MSRQYVSALWVTTCISATDSPGRTLTAHATSLVCADTDLRGPITIGPNVIIHPRATIYAVAGPIMLGEGCIVEEGCIIVNRCVCFFGDSS